MTDKPLHVRVAERIKAKVTVRPDGCWEWLGYRDRKGYGRFSLKNRQVVVARASYEAHVGPIAPEMTVDHLCRFTSCVNPGHLEVVSRGENTLRGETITGRNTRARACPHGHDYTEANTYVDRRGRRTCRRCKSERPRSASYKAEQAARARRHRAANPQTGDQRSKKREYDRRRYLSGVRRERSLALAEAGRLPR